MQGVTVRAGWGRQLWIWEGGILGQGTEVRKMPEWLFTQMRLRKEIERPAVEPWTVASLCWTKFICSVSQSVALVWTSKD